MTGSDQPHPWETAAEHRTNISGWVCTKCRRFHGDFPDSERSARVCCHTDAPCPQCPGRVKRFRNWCEACEEKRKDAEWAKLPRVDWDGETPLCEWDGDSFFYSPSDIESWLEGGDKDDPPRRLEDLRLMVCEPAKAPWFELSDFLIDEIPHEDTNFADRHDFALIDKHVNDFIKGLGVISWFPGPNAVTLDSLREHCPFAEEPCPND